MKSRVTLRPLVAGGQRSFVDAPRQNLRLHRPWVAAPLDEDSFQQYLRRFDGKHNFGFVVLEPATGRLVGAINLTNVVYGAFRSGYLGYIAFAGFEGKGLMRTGLLAVVRHAFTELKLHRLEANIQPLNAASIALVRRCGFAYEGYSPAYLKFRGKWRDHERWALVRGSRNAAPSLDGIRSGVALGPRAAPLNC